VRAGIRVHGIKWYRSGSGVRILRGGVGLGPDMLSGGWGGGGHQASDRGAGLPWLVL
jgi:hypothetical protein